MADMEKPKILGTSEDPTEMDVQSVRSSEEVSVWFSLNDLIAKPDETKALAALVKDESISNDLLKITTLEKDSDHSFEFLDKVKDLIDGYHKLEYEIDRPIREGFLEDLFAYLDKIGIQYDKQALIDRSNHLSVNYVDFVRYFGVAVRSGVDVQEACNLHGYYVQEGDSITINMTAIDSYVETLGLKEEEKESVRLELIKGTSRHELVHALSYRNYWLTENKDDGEPQTDSRRLGIRNVSLGGERIRLTWLNEAITERINVETHKSSIEFTGPEYYIKEQEVLNELCKHVDWKLFISACFTKNGFLELGREIKKKTGLTFSEIDNAMIEDEKENYKNNYTINLIKERQNGRGGDIGSGQEVA